NFRFYSRSPIDQSVSIIADEAIRKLSKSEIYDPNATYRVFIAGSPGLHKFLNGPGWRSMARNYEFGNPIYVPSLDYQQKMILHFDGRQAGAVNIIAHEAVHTLMQHRLGLLTVLKLPWWKKEGYAEYVASDSGAKSEAPPAYQEAAAVWKYLLET